MSRFSLQFNGDRAIDVRFSDKPSIELSAQIHALAGLAKSELADLIDVIPAYQCLTLIFESVIYDTSTVAKLKKWFERKIVAINLPTPDALSIHEIPVCYDDLFAPDKAFVIKHTGLDWEEIVRLHTTQTYPIAMLGFSPGFMYLQGLSEQLSCPRKSNPVTRLAAGSVGIGGHQTGVYPQPTPGGWQIIGRTPLPLFIPESSNPCPFQPLDSIRFVAITTDDFHVLARAFESTKTPMKLVYQWREVLK